MTQNLLSIRLVVFLLCIIIGLSIVGCSQPDGPYGSAVGPSRTGEMITDIYDADADTSYILSTGRSYHLYVGSAYGITADGLVRFYKVTTDSTMTVDSARIELHYEGGIGDGYFPEPAGQLIYTYWTENYPPNPSTLPTGNPVDAIIEETSEDTGKIFFPIPQAVIAEWLEYSEAEADTSEQNSNPTEYDRPTSDRSGLTLRIVAPYAYDRLVGFRYNATDSLRPQLHVFITIHDSAGVAVNDTTLSTFSIAELSLLTNDSTETGDQIIIGSGTACRSFVRFDISSLKARSEEITLVINRAVMTLHRDSSAFSWAPATKSVLSGRAIDDNWFTDPPATQVSLQAQTTAIDTTGDNVGIVVTDLVVQWITSGKDNYGIGLYSGGESSSIDRIAFYPSDYPDTTLQPKLTVYYTEFPR